MLSGKYKILYEHLISTFDKKDIYDDPLHTIAFGADASFYRLTPKLVIKTKNEKEVSALLKECTDLNLPVTFRAAGTSLSGQAITDSVLALATNSWNKFRINNDGSEISLQPGIIGGRANSLLSSYGRKIGPDPASVNAAMIGGIAANNASGMCCGISENSYKTVNGIRIILADGTILDTRSEESKEDFKKSHPQFVKAINDLARSAKSNSALAGRINKKYKIKNTTGYSLNALIDFTNPFDIIEHLMIGSEGTLGFISEINLKTVPESPFKASAFIIFNDIEMACKAVLSLKSTSISAAELIDYAGLMSVKSEKGVGQILNNLDEGNCALLVETTAAIKDELKININKISSLIEDIQNDTSVRFTTVPDEYEQFWRIRKGLFPSVGAMRKSGTTVIIEDVAFPVESLGAATKDLQEIIARYGYNEAVIFGHALEGNLHFVFTQDFNSKSEVDRYANLMSEVSELVVNKYDGSLKAEHGTGRNMAPFVEMEWGVDAYNLMKEIKHIFDPLNILNPGVILNTDNEIHLKNLKQIPSANEIIDKCTECGFCEPACVSADLTLTPRQRIVVHREITSLYNSGKEPHIAASIRKSFSYEGDDTCATDGLCAINCPVKIDTGKLIKNLRKEKIGNHTFLADKLSDNMSFVTSSGRIILSTVSFFHSVIGTRIMKCITSGLVKISGNRIPSWNQYMPAGAKRIKPVNKNGEDCLRKVVYFPSCINRSMGISADHKEEKQLSEMLVNLIEKCGFQVIYPENMNNLCCGMAFSSKGYLKAGTKKSVELEDAIKAASCNGKYPVLCDMSPCLFTMKENMDPKIKLYEPVEFILDELVQYLDITPLDESITVFPVCSMKKMGLEDKLVTLARLCAKEVIVPETNCCGFAGDRGFSFPELNKHGLKELKVQLPDAITKGYSTSRTCEIGLSLHSGISYKSIVYLIDSVSKPKTLNY